MENIDGFVCKECKRAFTGAVEIHENVFTHNDEIMFIRDKVYVDCVCNSCVYELTQTMLDK